MGSQLVNVLNISVCVCLFHLQQRA